MGKIGAVLLNCEPWLKIWGGLESLEGKLPPPVDENKKSRDVGNVSETVSVCVGMTLLETEDRWYKNYTRNHIPICDHIYMYSAP